jgi:hypothetical protein
MDSVLSTIRENPLDYLPEVSLMVFWQFWRGYDFRCAMEMRPHDWQFDRRAFTEWLARRFEVYQAMTLNDIDIVCSFTSNEVDAFHRYFDLLEEFTELKDLEYRYIMPKLEPKTLTQIIKDIRERPSIYLGAPAFRPCYSYLIGDESAYKDLQLPINEDRVTFENFKEWVETKKNQAQPRPWYKVISFWSGGLDCGHTSNGAFSIFYKWLDEYASEIGQPGLFSIT